MTLTSVEAVLELYRTWGPDRYDEEVTQLDHALQCAALARRAGSSDALIAAALLHDIGHLIDLREGGTVDAPRSPRHEQVGADALAALFPGTVTSPIALHVQAKRYLAATEPGYAEALSPGSTRSLERQGGPMDTDEVRAFQQDPGFIDACALRRWDDLGKVDGLEVEPLEAYCGLLDRVTR
ncbi:MAG: HD domain-containing protein [Acidobacteria bacterium]|nr:HD domain-containing protein [Acidobacteriota bacterium]